ncbi:hypothetical protein HanHA300_Chr03g0108891 [Helianthus annuus]|nr:hypothetical protein HanHA300_Chr03g0108891 [Helianthus annuus]KAJ0609509.1 hypothetical protein HanHA89_Chr03g0120771 [Helianthus annuus]KAJ0769561.1 hypothetical protein HanLR1_Chr03g0114131 [Helianthus annuus]
MWPTLWIYVEIENGTYQKPLTFYGSHTSYNHHNIQDPSSHIFHGLFQATIVSQQS